MLSKYALSIQDLLSDAGGRDLERASQCTPNLYKFDLENATVDFVTRCASSANSWEQRVQLYDFKYVIPEEERADIDPGITFEQLLQEYPDLMNSDVKVHCNCPKYLYFGHQYIMDQLDTGLEPEPRFPEIRNPELEGTVCKHLIAVFQRYFR